MKAAAFDYVKAKNLIEAIALLSEHGEDARLIAGGQTLLATLNLRLSEPSILIDITAVSELKGISVQGNMLRIGALVTHTEIESSDLIAQHAPLLKEAAPHIAHRSARPYGHEPVQRSSAIPLLAGGDHTRIGISTYSARACSFSRIKVGAPASARWSSTVSLSICPRISLR